MPAAREDTRRRLCGLFFSTRHSRTCRGGADENAPMPLAPLRGERLRSGSSRDGAFGVGAEVFAAKIGAKKGHLNR